MFLRYLSWPGLSALLLLAADSVVEASGSGPQPGVTGVPAGGGYAAEMTCQSCHESRDLNPAPVATITLEGLPEVYEPGARYRLALRVRHPGSDRLRWGFQITAVDLERYRAAGRFEVTDPAATQLIGGGFGDREYLEHTYQGTGIGQREGMTWTFAWRAPEVGGDDVGFFAAANVSNADGAKEGDWIFTSSPSPLARIRADAAAGRP